MSNVTVAKFRFWKGNPTDPDDSVIQAAIDAAEEVIADDLGRVMSVASTGSARLYVPDGSDTLVIHDCTTVTAVTVDGSAVASTLYQLEPVNNLTAAGDYSPYTRIRMLYGNRWTPDGARAVVSVTATWGWSALPDRYTEAVKILAADILEQRDIRNGVIGFTEYAGVRVKANPMVTGLLRKLRRAESWGIA